MLSIITVNELTLPNFLLSIMFRKSPYVLSIEALLPCTKIPMENLAAWAIKTGRAKDAIELTPELIHLRDRLSEVDFYNMFSKLEEWQRDRFSFDKIEKLLPEYAMAFKHLTVKEMWGLYSPVIILSEILKSTGSSSIKLKGLSPITAEIIRICGNSNVFVSKKYYIRLLYIAVNFGMVALTFLHTIGWMLWRTRPHGVGQKRVFFAADYIGDERDNSIYALAAKRGDLVLLVRQKTGTNAEQKLFRTYENCTINQGLLGPVEIIRCLKILTADFARIISPCIGLEPRHFLQAITLPYRRIKIVAFLNRYLPEYFWGRDDYNAEHILRHQEIQRTGGQSLGIAHGFSTYCDLTPAWRYISFDRYYVFGEIIKKLYRETWPPDMAIVPVGSFAAKDEDFQRILRGHGDDIAVLAGCFMRLPEFIEIIRALAIAFPERTIWLQVHSAYLTLPHSREFLDKCTLGLKNVVHSTKPLTSVFEMAGFAFSDPSTAILEAIQFGLDAFLIDIAPYHQSTILRSYEGLCVHSAEEAIERIKLIEMKKWIYPRAQFGELVNITGNSLFDTLRKDLELPGPTSRQKL